jgi:hypothetical protein
MADDDKDQEVFSVKDKRRFSEDEEEQTTKQGDPEVSPTTSESASGEPETASSGEDKHVPLPEIDFSTFILSLSSNALLHLGLMENPLTKKVERNLPVAKQTIDIVAMLKEKAKGNLTNEEENLVENLLTDLRLKYVEEANKG